MITRTFAIRLGMLVAFTAASFFVLAATGGKKKAATKSAITAKKATYNNFSLRSGFQFRGSKILKLNSSTPAKTVQFNSLALIKKDKVTYSVPYNQNLNVKGNGSTTKKYNNVEIKVVNIRL
ncbi:MAG: hypothetical protein JNM68_14675 [Dinghuibacter sp.]|nr:hypothetical protein [Dinghuibacter sp.]